jgi:hypothetical protein
VLLAEGHAIGDVVGFRLQPPHGGVVYGTRKGGVMCSRIMKKASDLIRAQERGQCFAGRGGGGNPRS